MSKNKQTHSQAYQDFLDAMDNSVLVKKMSKEEVDAFKEQYLHADVEEVKKATINIMKIEADFLSKQEVNEKAAQKAADELQVLTYEAENLIKQSDVPSEDDQREDDKGEIEDLENQLKKI